MRSVSLYTEEIDDLDEAVRDLKEQAKDFVLQKNSLAVIFTEDETDYPELYKRISAIWDFPIIGCSALAMLSGREGYCPVGISMMILTADDCTFTAGVTEELTPDDYRSKIREAYTSQLDKHNSEIKLILCYSGMIINEKNVAGDDLAGAIDEASGGVPLYGATASDGFSFNNFRVYCNDKTVMNGQVFALISGNINPRFVCINSIGTRASFSYEITQSDSNHVYRLGYGSFIDTLRKEGMEVSKTDVLGSYILSPFIVKVGKGESDHVEVARNLTALNHTTGAGTFLGVMPEGSTLSIGIITRNDVQKSVEDAFNTVFTEILPSDPGYHTLLCTSCCARFLALANNTSAEAETYMNKLPEGVSLMGFYAYGEYCPIKGDMTGTLYNMFHNFTFTILVM